MPPLWVPSYPDVVALANQYFAGGRFSDAALAYLQAASLAPITDETFLLRRAWMAHLRSIGKISELEA